MKKRLKNFLFLIAMSLLCFMTTKIVVRINQRNEISKNIKKIPAFSFKDLNGALFNNQNINKNKTTIFIYFNTECEFCNSESEMIYKNIDQFKYTQLLFISLEEPEKIKKFAQNYQLLNYDNIHFLYDKQASFTTTFDVTTLPTIVIYNSQEQLIEKIKGQIKVDYILKKINNQ